MTGSRHLGERVADLVDGELDHVARDRALAHLAHCTACRAEVEAHRRVKELLSTAPSPPLPGDALAGLLSLAAPGGPLPPRARTMPLGAVVPELPPPGRGPRLGRPGSRADSRHPGGRRLSRRARAAAGALSLAGVVLVTAFAAGGAPAGPAGPVVPPAAELSVEHGRTATAVTVGDPGLGLITGAELESESTGAGAPGR